MKKYLLSDRFPDPETLTTDGMKPEYYIRKGFLIFSIFDQVLNGLKTTFIVSPASYQRIVRAIDTIL